MPYSVVGIGTSWGGLAAMSRLLGELPADFSLPVVVVQHRSKDSDRLLSELLQDATDLKVSEVEDKEPLMPGTVHIAPANYHVLIDAGYLSLTLEEPVRFEQTVDRRDAQLGGRHVRLRGDWSGAHRSERRWRSGSLRHREEGVGVLWCRTRGPLRFRSCPMPP